MKPFKVSLSLNIITLGSTAAHCYARLRVARVSCCHSFCFVTLRFFCSRPHFIGVAAFASFVPHSAQQPHIFNPKESLPFTHYITFRPFLYVPLSFTTFIRSDKPSLDPAKETSLHAKNSASTPEAATVLITLRYTPHSLSATLAPLATASPYTSAAGKVLRYRYAAFPPPRCSRLLSLTLGKEV